MKLSQFLVLNAVVSLVYGIGELLMPTTILSIYGITQGPGEQLLVQFFGVALIGIGLLAWFARNVAAAEAQRAIVLAYLISNAIGIVVSVLGTTSGVMSAVGWSAVLIYLVLTLGYAYFQFMKKPGAA